MKHLVENINNFSTSTTSRNWIAIFCSNGRNISGSTEGFKLLIM